MRYFYWLKVCRDDSENDEVVHIERGVGDASTVGMAFAAACGKLDRELIIESGIEPLTQEDDDGPQY